MMSRSIDKKRVFISITLLCAVFVLPSTLTLFMGALLAIYYTHYFELAIAALLIDALYGPHGYATIGLFGYAVLFVLIIDHLRVRIRMRDNRRLY